MILSANSKPTPLSINPANTPDSQAIPVIPPPPRTKVRSLHLTSPLCKKILNYLLLGLLRKLR